MKGTYMVSETTSVAYRLRCSGPIRTGVATGSTAGILRQIPYRRHLRKIKIGDHS